MIFESRRRKRASENVVPLINVVFLLLIFFMLTATLQPPEATVVDLPSVGAESAREPGRDAPVLVLEATGRVSLAGRAVSVDALDELSAPEGLEIRADRDVPARFLLPLLERLDAAGIPAVDLVTRRAR